MGLQTRMPFIYNSQQQTVYQGDEMPTQHQLELSLTQFSRAIRYRRADGVWRKEYLDGETMRDIEVTTTDADTGVIVDIPNFFVRGIMTNDENSEGVVTYIDIPAFSNLRVRLIFGIDRPIRVTRILLGRGSQRDGEDIVLLG